MIKKIVKYKEYDNLIKKGHKVNVIKHSDFISNLFKLDKKVNDNLSDKIDYKYSNWSISRLELDNFLSYGDGNVIDFTKLGQLTLIPGTNQIGKTTAICEALTFLFFNRTEKTTKSEEILNIYRPDSNECKVKGWIKINEENYIIERTIIRKWKKDNTSFTTKTELNFFKELSNGEIEDLNGEQRQSTDKIIQESIGTIDDFLLTILTTGDNLTDIIELKPTDRGKILTRFLGLEIFEQKEQIAKEIFNDWKQDLKSNLYDIPTITNEIEEIKGKLKIQDEKYENIKDKLLILKDKINIVKQQRDNFLSKLHQDIDDNLSKSDPLLIEKKITDTSKEIKDKEKELKEIINKINEIKSIYNKEEHEKTRTENGILIGNIQVSKNTIDKIIKDIKNFEEGKVCLLCKRPFEKIDHSEEIKDLNKQLINNELLLKNQQEMSINYKEKMDNFEKTKGELELKDKLFLKRDRTEIEIDSLNINLQKIKDKKEQYHKNIDKINENIKTNEKIKEIGFSLHQEESSEKDLLSEQKDSEYDIKDCKKQIEDRIEIEKTIKKEQKIYKVFVSYLSLMGKSGISKSILKNYIPEINNELSKLLSDICNFSVEIDMNMNNMELILNMRDNKTQIVKPLRSGSGFEKTLSSLALRIVLSKINCLSKPDFIVLDEVLGKVSEENLQDMSSFFEKIKTYFSVVFLVTHNEKCKDWADKILTIEKNDNISSISLN